MKTPTIWRGRWRITELDETEDRDYLDLVVPAHITFDQATMGSFEFGMVAGGLDCRFSTRNGLPLVEFSWEGTEEFDRMSGRGWAHVHPDATLQGRLFFHDSDEF